VERLAWCAEGWMEWRWRPVYPRRGEQGALQFQWASPIHGLSEEKQVNRIYSRKETISAVLLIGDG